MFSRELQMAARCSYPYEEMVLDAKDLLGVDYAEILDILSRNKVLLTCYRNLSETRHGCNAISELEMLILKTIEKRKELLIDVRSKIMDLNELLKVHGVEFLLPKYTFFSREHNDIDVLVHPENFALTLELLNADGHLPTSVQSPWKVTMTKWKKGRRSAVHVHAKMHWQFEFIQTEKLWKRSIFVVLSDSVKSRVPCAEDSILLMAAHAMFENRKISLSDVFQFEGILQKFPDINWNEIVDIACENGWCSDLLVFLQTVNRLSYFLYSKILVPGKFFSYARKKISLFERNIRRLAASLQRTDFFCVPYSYPLIQEGISLAKIGFRKHGFFAKFKVLRSLVNYVAQSHEI